MDVFENVFEEPRPGAVRIVGHREVEVGGGRAQLRQGRAPLPPVGVAGESGEGDAAVHLYT